MENGISQLVMLRALHDQLMRCSSEVSNPLQEKLGLQSETQRTLWFSQLILEFIQIYLFSFLSFLIFIFFFLLLKRDYFLYNIFWS